MGSRFTPQDVAQHLRSIVHSTGELYQADAVDEIERNFGSEFLYENENGNPAIDRKVLNAFKKLTPDVVWEPRDRYWRQRESYDDPNARSGY